MRISPSLISFKAKPIDIKTAEHLKNRLSHDSVGSVDIICHEHTDRDALNSAIIVYNYLYAKRIQSRVILSGNLSELGSKCGLPYIQANKFDPEKNGEAETVVCVDFSSKERVSPDVLKYIESRQNIVCIDHHENPNLTTSKDFLYVDTTANSTTSILYRFLEASREDITPEQAYRVILGLVDDGRKSNLFEIKDGKIIPTDKLDPNSYEVFNRAYSLLGDEQKNRILNEFENMNKLSDDEENFKNSLGNKLQYSQNHRIAYVEILPDDNEWNITLGGFSEKIKKILSDFRLETLNKAEKTPFNPENPNAVDDRVVTVLTFYRTGENAYRVSGDSRANKSLPEFFKQVNKDIENNEALKPAGKGIKFSDSGGHEHRAGGGITTANAIKCHQWVENIISCDNFYD